MKNMNATSFLAAALVLAALAITACGGGSSDDGTANASGGDESSRPAPGGMFASLTDEQTQCLEDQGVSLPEMPEGAPENMPEGGPPEGMPEGDPPEGMPEGDPPEDLPEGATPPEGMGEGMEDLQSAMSECGIEMPTPPEGAPQQGADEAQADT